MSRAYRILIAIVFGTEVGLERIDVLSLLYLRDLVSSHCVEIVHLNQLSILTLIRRSFAYVRNDLLRLLLLVVGYLNVTARYSAYRSKVIYEFLVVLMHAQTCLTCVQVVLAGSHWILLGQRLIDQAHVSSVELTHRLNLLIVHVLHQNLLGMG